MSKFSFFGKKSSATDRRFESDQEVNFMNGISYKVNPLDTLKLVAGSSIFGEPSYYRNAHDTEKYINKLLPWGMEFQHSDTATTTDVFITAIDQALDHDFEATLLLAQELRQRYQMRLNPSLILVRAVMHPKRQEFAKSHPELLRKTGREIIQRPDDITNQFELYMFLYKSKSKMPSVLKRIWKDKLESFTPYQMNKYKRKTDDRYGAYFSCQQRTDKRTDENRHYCGYRSRNDLGATALRKKRLARNIQQNLPAAHGPVAQPAEYF